MNLIQSISDFLVTLCAQCCGIMYYLSDKIGVTYETLNMWFFYILQPCIYSLLLLWELLYLYSRTRRPLLRSALGIAGLLPVGYLVSLYLLFHGADLDALCRVKIHNLYAAAHTLGITYGAINDLIFIVGFLFICGLHLTFWTYRKRRAAYWLTLFFLLISPFFVYVFTI